MGRDLRVTIITFLILAGCVVLQSILPGWLSIVGVRPDFALIVLIFVALRRGSMVGQVAGFASGIVEDFASVSPLGFHMLLRSVIGFIAGLPAGNLFLDPLFMPILLTVIATIFKGLVSGLVSALFGLEASGFRYFAGRLWIEAACNALASPFLFALLGLFRIFKATDKEAV